MRMAGLAATAAAMMVTSQAWSQQQFLAGHGDVGAWYVEGVGYQLKLSNGSQWQYEPEAAVIVVNPRTQEPLSAALGGWAGASGPGGQVWKLPQSAIEAAGESAPWLGMQVHGGNWQAPPSGTTGSTDTNSSSGGDCGGSTYMHLSMTAMSGPGDVMMWQDVAPNAMGMGGAGGPGFENRADLALAPAPAFNSADGLGSGDYVCMWPGMHTHMNWGFTAPGDYQVTMQLAGHDPVVGDYYDAATYRFQVQNPLAAFGDLTNDGSVGGADLAALMGSFGKRTGAHSANGDFNGDGAVGMADLVILQRNWSTGIGSSASPVPEPSTVVLAALAGLVFCRPLMRKRAGV